MKALGHKTSVTASLLVLLVSGCGGGVDRRTIETAARNNGSAPFNLTIADTESVDHLYIDPSQSLPLQLTQCNGVYAQLLMDGPWVALDSGAKATSTVTSDLPGANLQVTSLGKITDFQIAERFFVYYPASVAPLGAYQATVVTTDSQVSRTVTIPIEVSACVPLSPAAACQGHTCGTVSDGCCGTITCGPACACVPKACGDEFAECGRINDGCGGVIDCGGCGNGFKCSSGVCNPVHCGTSCM
jgi:hypothetical protein